MPDREVMGHCAWQGGEAGEEEPRGEQMAVQLMGRLLRSVTDGAEQDGTGSL